MLKYLSVAAFINIISKISSIGISEVCNTDSLACFWERLYVLTKKAQVVVTIIFKNKSKNNYKNIVIRRNIDVAKWNRHRDTLSYSVYSIRKSHSGGLVILQYIILWGKKYFCSWPVRTSVLLNGVSVQLFVFQFCCNVQVVLRKPLWCTLQIHQTQEFWFRRLVI